MFISFCLNSLYLSSVLITKLRFIFSKMILLQSDVFPYTLRTKVTDCEAKQSSFTHLMNIVSRRAKISMVRILSISMQHYFLHFFIRVLLCWLRRGIIKPISEWPDVQNHLLTNSQFFNHNTIGSEVREFLLAHWPHFYGSCFIVFFTPFLLS